MYQFHDATVRGESLETFGYESAYAYSPWSLFTFGLIAECPAIWSGMTLSLSTSWSTVWGTSSTTWTAVGGSMWGDC